jgi:hypothetical protein
MVILPPPNLESMKRSIAPVPALRKVVVKLKQYEGYTQTVLEGAQKQPGTHTFQVEAVKIERASTIRPKRGKRARK